MLSAQRDGRGGVAAEATADGVGDDPEALAELVHEAEGARAVPHVRPDQEDARHLVRVRARARARVRIGVRVRVRVG